jgi:uncharacterized protein (DUF2147 family)
MKTAPWTTRQAALRLPLALGALLFTAGIALAADPTGTWVRPSTGTTVKFYGCGDKLCAKIVGVKDKSKQSTVGTVIMSGAKKVSDNKWEGDLLNTEDGQTYNGVVTLSGGGLTLKGCVLGGIICKGETWSRVD